MPLSPGTRIGQYDVMALIGAGGMGEVYRARDTRLNRDVALKVLPEHLAADPDRVVRFKREAHVLASLNHPNIAAIYGVEEGPAQGPGEEPARTAPHVLTLVLELVEGPTLADRIAEGALPLEEALPTARQVAEALETAHDHAIVHRDLKPANIKLRPDGTVKVLDFGVAKVFEAPQGGPHDVTRLEVTASPTLSPGATGAGMILGTAAYMSPEQARGKPVDKRTDVWAFGCVLYEMLTGKQAFGGGDVADTLAFIITKEPDWSALPANTPPAIHRLLRRCLDKDRRERLADVSVARLEIKEALTAPAAVPGAIERRPSRLAWVAVAALAVALLGLLPFALAHFREAPPAAQAIHFAVPPPEGGFFTGGPALAPGASISSDGRQIVLKAQVDGVDQLWVRRLDAVEARPLPGTTGGDLPFWSPDGRFIAYFAGGRLLKFELATGGIQTLSEVTAPEGGTWNRDGVILFSGINTPLLRISDEGGTPESVTELEPPHVSHRWPQFLPDGRRFLFLAQPGNEIRLGSLDSPQSTRLFVADSKALYAAGYVLFVRRGTLFAQPFDESSGATTGDAVPVASELLTNAANGRAMFTASDNGVLAYRSGEFGEAQLTWFDRDGKRLAQIGQLADFRDLWISPDDRQAVVHIHDEMDRGGGLWLVDLLRGTTSRFTGGGSHDSAAVWSPRGDEIFFSSARQDRIFQIYKRRVGGGSEDSILQSDVNKSIRAVAPDLSSLLFSVANPKTLTDLWMLPLSGDRAPRPWLQGPYDEDQAQFSPDGRWVAYVSNETGQAEVYLQSIESTGKVQISTGGGIQPQWRGDGRELFFLVSGTEPTFMATELRPGPGGMEAGIPRALFRTQLTLATATIGPTVISASYAVTRDGRRILAVTPPPGRAQAAARPLMVIVNFAAALGRN